MTAPAQPPLDLGFPRRQALDRRDFLVSIANADAAALIDRWRDWPERRLALIGPQGSGKTHLVHVFAAESGAPRVAAADLGAEAAPDLVAAGAAAIEDVDRLAGAEAPERALFHLLNLAAAAGATVLVTGRVAPARWPVALPDLASRLQAMPLARLLPPDDALLGAVIAKLLDDRRLAYDPALPGFLARRIERSFAAAEATVARLDAASLSARRPINRRFAAELLGADR